MKNAPPVEWEDDPAEIAAARLLLMEAAFRLAEWSDAGTGDRRLAGPECLRRLLHLGQVLAAEQVHAAVEDLAHGPGEVMPRLAVVFIRMVADDRAGRRPAEAIACAAHLPALRSVAEWVITEMVTRSRRKRKAKADVQ